MTRGVGLEGHLDPAPALELNSHLKINPNPQLEIETISYFYKLDKKTHLDGPNESRPFQQRVVKFDQHSIYFHEHEAQGCFRQ